MAIVLALIGVISETGLVKVITSIWDKLVKVFTRSSGRTDEQDDK